MNIHKFKAIYLVALFFTIGCQKTNPVASKPAILKPTISNEILNETAQVTRPQSKIRVATSIVKQSYRVHPVLIPKLKRIDNNRAELGTLRLGEDNCFYVELDGGIKVLPVLISDYSSPKNLSFSYTKALGKKVVGFLKNDAIDLTSAAFNASSLGWVTSPPHQQCDISLAHQYYQLDLSVEPATPSDDWKTEQIIDYLNVPKNEGKLSYIGVYSYANLLYEGDPFIAGRESVDEGVLFTEKDCLYIRFKNGKIALPIFKTQRTFWQDTKNALRASGKDWHLGETYSFGTESSNTGGRFDMDIFGMINPPHPSCNAKQVRYILGIYEPAEFKQKRAAFEAEQKAVEANHNKQAQ